MCHVKRVSFNLLVIVSAVMCALATLGTVWPTTLWTERTNGWYYSLDSWDGCIQFWRNPEPPPVMPPDATSIRFLAFKEIKWVNGSWQYSIAMWPIAVVFAILPVIWLTRNYRRDSKQLK